MKKDNQNESVMLPIGTIAKALNVSQTTIRDYDSEYILPAKRTETNRRYYTLEDIERGNCIRFLLRNLLLNIDSVKVIFAIMENEKIKPENRLDYLKKIALKAGITEEIQQKNQEKYDNKGRK